MRLPASAQEIANVIGIQKTLLLIGQLPRTYAGIITAKGSAKSHRVNLYVPTIARLTPDHTLVRILGFECATALCRHFGGEILYPANCSEVYRQFRDRSIVRMISEENMTLAEVAELFSMSERQIRNIIAEIPHHEKTADNDNHSPDHKNSLRGEN